MTGLQYFGYFGYFGCFGYLAYFARLADSTQQKGTCVSSRPLKYLACIFPLSGWPGGEWRRPTFRPSSVPHLLTRCTIVRHHWSCLSLIHRSRLECCVEEPEFASPFSPRVPGSVRGRIWLRQPASISRYAVWVLFLVCFFLRFFAAKAQEKDLSWIVTELKCRHDAPPCP